MEHPAHVRLVDSHPERDRGRDDAGRALEELAPSPGPWRPAPSPAWYRVTRSPAAARVSRAASRARVGRGVDDPRASELGRGLRDQPLLVFGRARVVHGQLDVRPVEVPDHDLGIAQPEPPADLAPHRRRRSRGERDPHARAELVGLRAEPQVVGAEIEAPLADQVGLVDDEQPRALTRRSAARVSWLESCSGETNTNSSGPQASTSAAARAPADCAEFRTVADSRRPPEVRQLVVLQRYQRRYDDGGPAAQQARQLVDRRLAAAGGQNRDHVAPGDGGGDRLLLTRPQRARTRAARARPRGSSCGQWSASIEIFDGAAGLPACQL